MILNKKILTFIKKNKNRYIKSSINIFFTALPINQILEYYIIVLQTFMLLIKTCIYFVKFISQEQYRTLIIIFTKKMLMIDIQYHSYTLSFIKKKYEIRI